MLYRFVLFMVLVSQFVTPGFSQSKSITAFKSALIPKIDGSLDDAAWKEAPLATGFTQFFPNAGDPASARTEVRILYDDNAVYIGAFLHDDPKLIRRQLTGRDGEQQSDVDYFSIFFDTYSDQQNGFQFLVTAANVQTDARLSGAGNVSWGEYGDKSWDAVWQSKTAITDSGWIAEMRIPYISLRFAKKEVQSWGLQFLRFIRRNSESSFWNTVQPNLSGFVNQFGKWENLREILPPLRLSFSPYLSTGVRSTPMNGGYSTEWLRSGGLDVKYGINESFTLDATLIPDFGQVISDNVINNLSPFEVQFQENRPFFTEGTELFNKAGLFYSKRVGARPMDYGRALQMTANGYRILRNPGNTQLYNGIKFSGRTENKLGIGIFNAVTAPMYAELQHEATGRDTTISTEPLTNYNIIVLDQAFRGRSYLTFTNTNVLRNGNLRDANVSALDYGIYDRKNEYALTGAVRYSNVSGHTPYSFVSPTYRFISDLDTFTSNSRRYIKPYDGFSGRIRFAKVSGNVQFHAGATLSSDSYDPNDLGIIQSPNDVAYSASVSYHQFQPTKNFINYTYSLNLRYMWLYQPYRFSGMEVYGSAFWLFKNMWDVRLTTGAQPYWQNDYFELRTPGSFVKKPWYAFAFIEGSTDSRKRLYVAYELGFAEGALPNNPYFRTIGDVRYRFSNKFNLSLSVDRQHDFSQVGYSFLREANGDPIVSFREYKDISTILSGNYNFTSRMNITLRARQYWSRVHYQSFYNVKRDGFYQPRAFINDRDENLNIFNVDAFFTWDFRPGSRVVAGWKNWLGDDYLGALSPAEYRHFGKNFRQSLSLPHGNEFSLRVIYFLDYNQLRK